MIIAARGYDVSTLPYEKQCEHCEAQIENLAKIWRQRTSPCRQPLSGFHVWVLTSGSDEDELASDTCHSAGPADAVSSSIAGALRDLYRDCIGPEKFLEITWELSAHNVDLFIGHTPELEDAYWLVRHAVV